MDEKKNTPARTSRFRISPTLYFPPTYKPPKAREWKELVDELQAQKLMTEAGLPVTLELKAGILEVFIACTEDEWQVLKAQRAARRQAEQRKHDDLARLRKALRETKARDYKDDPVQKFGVTVMQKRGMA
jgi:hypothetical protein